MVLSSSTWAIVGLVAVVFLAVIGLGVYTLTRLRARKRKLSLELDSARELVEDRAYNQLRMARTEADVLERQGVDVSRPRALLADAESARTRRDFDTALGLARSAHEVLVKLRLQPGTGALPAPPGEVGAARVPGGPRSPAWPPAAGGSPLASEDLLAAPSAGGSSRAEGSRPVLPKNKAESKFQLSLLADELTRATAERGANAAVTEATEIREKGDAAFARGDFTEAMRLALRGRRRLGTQVESLPMKSVGPSTGTEASTDVPLVCGGCGEPLRPTDRFCRYCGTLRGPARCAGCGTALDSDDQFCASCGRPVAPAPAG